MMPGDILVQMNSIDTERSVVHLRNCLFWATVRRQDLRTDVRYGKRMSVPSAACPEPVEPYEVIHLGGEAAAIVPLAELRRLRAVERHASPEALEEAEIEATLAAHDEWVAAGCPGARSHEDVMAELLGGDQ